MGNNGYLAETTYNVMIPDFLKYSYLVYSKENVPAKYETVSNNTLNSCFNSSKFKSHLFRKFHNINQTNQSNFICTPWTLNGIQPILH